jgi:uncharacterized protein (TIGR02453 family)
VSAVGFDGFPKEAQRFLGSLAKNNRKVWFDAHRDEYERYVLEPAIAFVTEVGPRLRKIDPGIRAEPRINGSIGRINRDIRFSKDKSPYKDHLNLWFWQGPGKRGDAVGYYWALHPTTLVLGAGFHMFEPKLLARYRDAVADPKRGGALVKAIAEARKSGYDIGGAAYKRVPAGYDVDAAREPLLLHNGLWVGTELRSPREVQSSRLVDLTYEHFRRMEPVRRWLLALTRP